MAYNEKQIESIFGKIIKQVAEGKSLRNVLRQSKMPSSQTFYIWIDKDSEKSKQYARACSDRADAMFEDMFYIADATEDDVIKNEDGKPVTNHNVIQRDRLRVDTRKWALSKMNPKKYGDKIDVTSGGDKVTSTTPYLTPQQKKILDEELNSDY